MSLPIVGICRFSFLGSGDWLAYRKAGSPEEREQIMNTVAKSLYSSERLNLRFWFFENVLMPSIAGQRDKDFIFLVLTSPELPEPYMERLRKDVAGIPMARLVVSSARSVSQALEPELERIRTEAGSAPMQFRIDDDDCVAVNFVAELRHAAKKMFGPAEFGITMPKTIVVTAYKGEGLKYYKWFSLFHSVGCAVFTNKPKSNVFNFAHNLIYTKIPSMVLPLHTSAIMFKFDGHDSPKFLSNRSQRDNSEPTDWEKVSQIIDNRFPFLKGVDFSEAERLRDAADV